MDHVEPRDIILFVATDIVFGICLVQVKDYLMGRLFFNQWFIKINESVMFGTEASDKDS